MRRNIPTAVQHVISYYKNIRILKYSEYNSGQKLLKFCLLFVVIGTLAGCGFHLRGNVCIPGPLQTLAISPDAPFDPFQRILRRTLKDNQVQVVELCAIQNDCRANILCLLEQKFSERNIAFGSDVQVNRVLLQFKVKYQITDHEGNIIVDCNTLQVERELTINPNAVLGTDHDRQRVQNELYNDAAVQLIRQLSLACLN